MIGDGAGHFSSLFYLVYSDNSMMAEIRAGIVSHVSNNWQRFKCFTQQLSRSPYGTKRQYLTQITESVLGPAIRLERKRFRTKTRVNTVTRYYGTMRRFAGETGAASLGNDETSATRSGYTTLPRKCEQRH
ncbi:hypothetical protein AVEN_98378-1 [Araneus ventricosus]|uniref:Uncharacterized protein n=1 Tax=Araneus ventricosus TaxID=182803 RepID=A0A4Y2JIJ5_ARAVE|nr:hypothetical protein AVEN_98378-1 [Araneus ventricosus]